MSSVNAPDQRMRTGTWLYDGIAESRVEIWRRSRKPGSGDYEDPPEAADDQVGEWYEVQFEPAGGGRIGQAGGGYYPTLEEALERVRLLTHGTIRWSPL